ncbi:MAG: SpoIIE family protein phosphatase [bacterium]|nr:SpoIIE family protein phosphatase [bacterium]
MTKATNVPPLFHSIYKRLLFQWGLLVGIGCAIAVLAVYSRCQNVLLLLCAASIIVALSVLTTSRNVSRRLYKKKLEMANSMQMGLRKSIEELLSGKREKYSFQWLLPHMHPETFKKGETVFKKGDSADKMYYIHSGQLYLPEISKSLGQGTIIGETGLFSPSKERTASAICEEDLELYSITLEEAGRFFYSNPSLIFELVQISTQRFVENFKESIESKERLESDLRIANDIQTAMLPRQFPPFPHREEFDIIASMEPAKEVGGDFYDFFFIDETKLCFFIGDVSGKGVPAALFMVITKTLLRTEALRDLSPENILYNVNNILWPDNDECMFVTIFCAVLDTETGELVYANAGHNPPILTRKGKECEYLQMGKSLVLGPIPDSCFCSSRLFLSVGDTLFLYTDGVTEAMNSRMELFSDKRLLRIMSGLKERELPVMLDVVRQEITKFAREAPQSDDIAMLAIQYKGRGSGTGIEIVSDSRILKNKHILARLQLFEDVDLDKVLEYLEKAKVKILKERTVLLAPDKKNTYFYILLSGHLYVHLKTLKSEPYNIIHPGESVGEMSVLDKAPPAAYVVAAEESRVLAIDEKNLWELVNNIEGVARNLLHTLTGLIRHADGTILESKEKTHYANIDPLTGLHNRRWLESVFSKELSRATTLNSPSSLIFIDIDQFTELNDRQGQIVGDMVLYIVAESLKRNTRPSDLLARFGSETFCILLPGSQLEPAALVAERLRKGVSDVVIVKEDTHDRLPVSISLGIAQQEPKEELDSLLERARKSMLEAKEKGSNQVVS